MKDAPSIMRSRPDKFGIRQCEKVYRNLCRPLKRTRLFPRSLSHNLRRGLIAAIAPRLEPGLSNELSARERITFFPPPADPAVHRNHVRVSHFLEVVGRKS